MAWWTRPTRSGKYAKYLGLSIFTVAIYLLWSHNVVTKGNEIEKPAVEKLATEKPATEKPKPHEVINPDDPTKDMTDEERFQYLCKRFMQENFKSEPKRPPVTDDHPKLSKITVVPKEARFIPQRIHQMYKDEQIHSLYKDWVQSWPKNHPKWTYFFWTDNDLRNLISDHYPEYLGMFDSYSQPLQRADAGRYFVLHHYGGVYADIDFQSLRPLDGYISDKTCILAPEPEEQSLVLYNKTKIMTNSIMACSKGHPFLKRLIASLPLALKRHKPIPNGQNLDILYTTGPQQLQLVLDQHRLYDKSGLDITHASYKHLVPTTDPGQGFEFYCSCLAREQRIGPAQTRACDSMRQTAWQVTDTSQAYAEHHWTHLGYEDLAYRRKEYDLIHLYKILDPAHVHRYQNL